MDISWKTFVIFLIGAAIFVPLFKVIFHSASRKRRVAALSLIGMIGLISFLYPLRFVPSEKFGEIFAGLGMAACVLSAIGGILFAIRRFLDADEQRTKN
jgi:nitrate reductase gamma subunit